MIRTGFCFAIFLLTFGCGGNDLPIVPVSGRITFEGGPCPAPGTISFTPVELSSNLPNRPGSAKFGVDGVFTATSFQSGDGLLPGRYRVRISCYTRPPDFESPADARDANAVPHSFVPEEVIVEQDQGSIYKEYDIPAKVK